MFILVNKKDGLIAATETRKFPDITYVNMENPTYQVEVESILEGMTHYVKGEFTNATLLNKNTLRPIRNALLDEAEIKYCNADKWELMDFATKKAWRTWKKDMKDWVGVDLNLGTFPAMPG